MNETEREEPTYSLSYVLQGLLRIAWRFCPSLLIFYFAVTLVASLCPVALTAIQKMLIDQYATLMPSVPLETTIITSLIMLGMRSVVISIQGFFRGALCTVYLSSLLTYRMQNALSYLFAEKLVEVDVEQLENSKVQSTIEKARSSYLWRTTDLLHMLVNLSAAAVACVVSFCVLLRFSSYLPFLLLLVTVPRFFVQSRYGTIQWSIWASGVPDQKKLYYLMHLLTSVNYIPELRVFQAPSALLKQLAELQAKHLKRAQVAMNSFLGEQWAPILIEGGVLCVLAILQLQKVLSGEMSIGAFTLFLIISEQFVAAGVLLITSVTQLKANSLFASHFFEVMNLPKSIVEPPDAQPLDSRQSPTIEFRNVTFEYPNGRKALDNISFTIPSGTSLAFVGANGAGKSTLMKLLYRQYDVTTGEIIVNGRNIKELQIKDWYNHLGALFQNFSDYHFTISENLRLGVDGPPDQDRMAQAAKLAMADEFIVTLPNQYDQMLGKQFDGGEDLSWGQWQKLSIARAFYRNSSILILDEPTSAIDAVAEQKIFENLFHAYAGKTLIIVSHRLSMARLADRIIVLSDGRILEEGRHDELMQSGGTYASMFTAQALGYN